MKILIADDEPMNLKLLRAILESEDHEVLMAADGEEALAILKEQEVDAIVSDILMPRMDGYRFCQEIRKDPRWQALPFIFYTATYTSQSDEDLALRVGGDAYIMKPAAHEVLVATLEQVCGVPRRPMETALPESTTVMKEYNEVLIRKLEHKNAELERAQAAIIQTNEDLELRVKERTAELEIANEELDAFSHSAAHDLRSPLRSITAYSQMLMQDLGTKLEPREADYLLRIKESALRMDALIGELLKLSYIGRHEINRREVDLSALVVNITDELRRADPTKEVEVVVATGIVAEGDRALLSIALENLLSNAWKFSSKQPHPRIEFASQPATDPMVCFVRDNGAGFDMAYKDKLFDAFQRMHGQHEFPGTGLGLTIVKRIIARHDGEIWAESEPNRGATFYIRL